MSNSIEAISATDAVAITKSDATIYCAANGGHLVALYVGGAGNVAIRTLKGNTVTFPSVPAGGYVLCACDKVMSTNTTATNIVGLRY